MQGGALCGDSFVALRRHDILLNDKTSRANKKKIEKDLEELSHAKGRWSRRRSRSIK